MAAIATVTRLADGTELPEHGRRAYVYGLCFVAALGGLLFGFDTAIINGALKYTTAHFGLDERTQAGLIGFVVASAILGCIPGSMMAGPLSDAFGRKRILILAAVFYFISAVGSAFPGTLTGFVLYRFLGGLGVGAASMLSPLYIAEVSPARMRGSLVSLNQLAIILGILLAFVAGFCFKDLAGNWRWMFGSESFVALLFFLVLLPVPESPRWLTKQRRESQALAIMARVGGRVHAEAELAEIRGALAEEGASLSEILRPGLRLALLIGIALAVFQQITGINTVLYFSTTMFERAGLGEDAAFMSSVGVGAINVLFTLVAIFWVDRLGRKPFLLAGAAGMGVALGFMGAAFQFGWSGKWLLVATLAYVACFAATLGPVVWVYIAEIFPTRIRGRSMSVSVVFLWVACALMSYLHLPLVERIGAGPSFWLYGSMCLLMFIFVAALVPETKGKTLEQIERHWLRP